MKAFILTRTRRLDWRLGSIGDFTRPYVRVRVMLDPTSALVGVNPVRRYTGGSHRTLILHPLPFVVVSVAYRLRPDPVKAAKYPHRGYR